MAGEVLGVVRGARKEDRSTLGTLRYDHHCMQLYPVAHRDHEIALDVVKAPRFRNKLGRGLTREVRVFGLGFLSRNQGGKQGAQDEQC